LPLCCPASLLRSVEIFPAGSPSESNPRRIPVSVHPGIVLKPFPEHRSRCLEMPLTMLSSWRSRWLRVSVHDDLELAFTLPRNYRGATPAAIGLVAASGQTRSCGTREQRGSVVVVRQTCAPSAENQSTSTGSEPISTTKSGAKSCICQGRWGYSIDAVSHESSCPVRYSHSGMRSILRCWRDSRCNWFTLAFAPATMRPRNPLS
jgi:hypothetical protein